MVGVIRKRRRFFCGPRNVARPSTRQVGGPWGTPGEIPGTAVDGGSYSTSYTRVEMVKKVADGMSRPISSGVAQWRNGVTVTFKNACVETLRRHLSQLVARVQMKKSPEKVSSINKLPLVVSRHFRTLESCTFAPDDPRLLVWCGSDQLPESHADPRRTATLGGHGG